MDESLYALAKECRKISRNQSEFEIVLVEHSRFYKKFANCLSVRTVEAENQNRTALKVAMTEYKDLINEGNVNQFIKTMKRKKAD